MVLSTADGTPVDLFMTKVGVPKARYRKWMNGFPKIENTRGCVRGDQVLCVARLSPEKGVDYVIDSFAKALPLLHRPHKLVIVGDGPDADRLRTQVRELELEGHVYFAGETFDVADHLYSSRLLVSGLANNTVMEAIATGTPVITVDLGEMRNLYGGYRNVFIVDYPPGGYGRIEPRHRDRVIADTSRMIVEVLNGRQAPARASETDGPALYSWDDRLSAELELYDSLFDS
jgi:glycosyltransferase involved in cell wall biosynthesis